MDNGQDPQDPNDCKQTDCPFYKPQQKCKFWVAGVKLETGPLGVMKQVKSFMCQFDAMSVTLNGLAQLLPQLLMRQTGKPAGAPPFGNG